MDTITQTQNAIGSELVKSVSIENLVNQRAAVVEKVKFAFDVLREAASNARAANIGFPEIGVCDTSRNWRVVTGDYPDKLDAHMTVATKTIDAGAWKYLMSESGLRTFMDAQARQDWDKKIYANDVPELTADTIRATFTNMHNNRGEMFERGVIALFRALSWDYKTNQPFKFSKRIIFNRLFTVYGSGAQRWITTDSRSADKLDDLDRVLHILDEKPEPDHRVGWNRRLMKNKDSHSTQGSYFDLKWYMNGNGHILFTRPDLMEKMNLIVAKHHPNAIASEAR